MPASTITTPSLKITTQLSGNHWVITATTVDASPLPKEIFMFFNTGTDELGRYAGVCNLTELKRVQLWENKPVNKFGNLFVRTSQAKIILSLDRDTQKVIRNMISTAANLLKEYTSVTQDTTIYPIVPAESGGETSDGSGTNNPANPSTPYVPGGSSGGSGSGSKTSPGVIKTVQGFLVYA